MQYWLFKSEPNTWSWDQQVAKGDVGEEWDGIRNYQARNFMRTMEIGDRDCNDVQLSAKSPNPDSPINVSVCAPSAPAKRASSANPRVINAARALSSSPAPTTIPQAMA